MTACLADFRLEPGVYRLGQFAPVSIRDQVIRANLVVDALDDADYLTPEMRLVVVGAGAAGISVALAAQRIGVASITILERADQAMQLQQRSSTRHLDPVQYDWPAAYWDEEQWPIADDVPRRFTAVDAPFNTIVAQEADKWASWFIGQALGARLQIHTNRDVVGWRKGTTGRFLVETAASKHVAAKQWPADVVIVATGFGWEVASAPNTNGGQQFVGLDFWSTDPFETPNRGLPKGESVLVSGTGDGSLQEYIRLLTGEVSARNVLKRILNATPPDSTWKASFAALGHWDRHAATSLMAVTKAFTECEVYTRLHAKFKQAVIELKTHSDWQTVTGLLDSLTNSRSPGVVTLLMKCTHFGKCYALNRLVALILIEHLEDKGIRSAKTRTALSSTAAIGHVCQPGCWGQKHQVTLALGTDCVHTGRDIAGWKAAGALTTDQDYLGLVIRHGIKPLASPHFPTVALATQEVPCHLP